LSISDAIPRVLSPRRLRKPTTNLATDNTDKNPDFDPCHPWLTTPWGASGRDLTRTPVASKIAFATAGANPTIGVSPAPADGKSFRSSNTISIAAMPQNPAG